MEMNEQKKRHAMIIYVIIGVVVIILLNAFVTDRFGTSRVTPVAYTDMTKMIDDGVVDEFNYNISSGEITFSAHEGDGLAYYTTTHWPNDYELLKRLEAGGARASTKIVADNSYMFIYLLTFF